MAKTALAVIYSDIHFNKWQQFAKTNGTERLDWTIKAHEEIIAKAKELRVPTLFCGDMFHDAKKLGNDLLDSTLPYFNKVYNGAYSQTEYAISGNHDQNRNNFIGNESPSYVKTLAKTLERFHCIDFQTKVTGELQLFGIPYISHNIGFMDKVEEYAAKIKKGKTSILMIHTDIPKAVTSTGYEFEDVDNIPDKFYKAMSKFDFVLDGHIHKPTMEPMHKNIYIIGSPIQQNVGDSLTPMGYWILWSNKEMEFVPLDKYPQFFYHYKGEETDDFNYWVELPSKETNNTSELQHQTDYVSIKGRKKLVRKYFKVNNIKNKRKAKFLTKLLLDAESDI